MHRTGNLWKLSIAKRAWDVGEEGNGGWWGPELKGPCTAVLKNLYVCVYIYIYVYVYIYIITNKHLYHRKVHSVFCNNL